MLSQSCRGGGGGGIRGEERRGERSSGERERGRRGEGEGRGGRGAREVVEGRVWTGGGKEEASVERRWRGGGRRWRGGKEEVDQKRGSGGEVTSCTGSTSQPLSLFPIFLTPALVHCLPPVHGTCTQEKH